MKHSPMLSLRVWTHSAQIALLRARARLLRWLAPRADALRFAILLGGGLFVWLLAVHAIATIAPRVSPEVAQQQRTTAPWMTGERR